MAPFKKRERKHKNRRSEATQDGSNLDSNAFEILPADQAARKRKHEEARETLKQQQPKMSSKKKKRLDKYIDTKLRKEENLELLKKLGSSTFDTSLLRSSKSLGLKPATTRNPLTLDLGTIGVVSNAREHSLSDSDSSSEDLADDTPNLEAARSRNIDSGDSPVHSTQAEAVPSVQAADFGLKRPLDIDESGNPIIKKRQRLQAKPDVVERLEEISWDGFSSEASDGDSSDIGEDDDSSLDSELDSDDSTVGSSDDDPDGSKLISLFASAKANANEVRTRPTPRANSDFKLWATQQINEFHDFTPSGSIVQSSEQRQEHPAQALKPRPIEQDPLPQELQINLNATQRKAFSVQVERPPEVQEARMKLPIVAEEQKIMEAIHNNPVTIVRGATGCGKTTQVPQFLYEAGYGNPNGPTPGMIGITQPRRVAASTMARRVGEELGNSDISSYQIRFDASVGKRTAIKFMTDGILIREISQDFALSKYSAIIIDEAHERSINTDILIGMLSRVVDLRLNMSMQSPDLFKPLKLIIMSATLASEAFLENPALFSSGKIPPVVESEGRQYPVTVHFARRTQRDYLDDARRKVIKGHSRLPPGGMIVFLTGQNEIVDLAKKLSRKLALHQASQAITSAKIAAKDAPLEIEDAELGEDLVDDFQSEEESGDEDEDKEFEIEDKEESSSKALILPLYSQLPTKEQLRVFEPPPENTRLIVLTTNVAETSITIPGIRYVIDCGRSKEKTYDKTSGVQGYSINWISKASAAQRTGRAGRTAPGHAYRLYSSAVYERDFAEHTDPEILKVPVEGVVLQLKAMDLKSISNFPFPTPPDKLSIAKAEKLLSYLGALDQGGKVTSLGRDLSIYPLSPRFAKMLAIAIGNQQHCPINYTAGIVASLAVPELFIPESQLGLGAFATGDDGYSDQEQAEHPASEKQKAYNKAHYSFSAQDRHSDVLKLLSAFCAYMWASNSEDDLELFCARMFLKSKAMKETLQLYKQLVNIIALNHPGTIDTSKTPLSPPSKPQIAALKQIVAAGFLDNVAIRADLAPQPPDMVVKNPKRAIDIPYLPLLPIHEGRAESLGSLAVFIHPSSLLAHTSPKNLPQYLIYSTLQRSSPSAISSTKPPKTRMHPLTPITGTQLAALANGTPLLEYGKPIGKILEVEGERDKRIVWLVPSLVGEDGGRGWPLPAVKALQKRDAKGEWGIERIER